MQKYHIILILVANLLYCQTDFKEHISNFNMTSLTYKHDAKWSAYYEMQLRSVQDYMLPDYYEIKGGIGYNVAKGHQIFGGIGKYGTYKKSDFYQKEFRMWLQYTMSHQLSPLKIDHRLRAEKRFYNYPQTKTKSNTERYRYRISLTLPINNEKVMSKTFFVNTFEEIFVGPEDPFFKRNRIFGGLGYQFNDILSTNFGYMFQREFSSDSAENYHFIYMGLNFTLDRSKLNDHSAMPVVD